jgi:putative transposase
MMKYNPEKHRRRLVRIPGYDYSQDGGYFVTICVNHRQCIFGHIKNGKMELNFFGNIIKSEWLRTAHLRKNVKLDKYIIMPNHIHGIIQLIHENVVGAYCDTPLQPQFISPSQTIGAIIRGFKSVVTKRINKIKNSPGVKLWQRNYYEHIIRDNQDLNRIRQYIINNPLNWPDDKYYI